MIGDLKKLIISRSRFTLKTTRPIALSDFAGSTLRGAFGIMFRKIVCAQRHLVSCRECYLKNSCAYSVIFEPRSRPDSNYFPRNQQLPSSFLFYIKEDEKDFNVGEEFNLVLTLIGKASEYFPYFLIVLQELGMQGFGLRDDKGKRGSYEIVEITDELATEQKIVFSGGSNEAMPPLYKKKLGDMFRPAKDIFLMKVHFITPLRVKWRGHLSSDIQFHILFRNALRRLSALYYLSENIPLQLDYRSLISKSENIETLQAELGWNEFTRYSNRQKERMKLGGVTGWAIYQGEISPFYPFLKAAELTAVGKGTTFGFGRIALEIMEKGG